MADRYNLYEYKEITAKWGTARLNIYQKHTGLVPRVQKIGDVLAALNFGIQGADEAVDSPIQKTSLEFALVDAPERNKVNEAWGGWESFFTSDATAYKVELVVNGAVRWTGFITPDSWEEDLSYHAPVSIIARDNWGRLNDFMFDHEGNADNLISVADLLFAAKEKAGVVMDVEIDTDAEWPECNGVALYEHFVNVRAFEDRTWWDALSDTLASLGIVLQYEDYNTFKLRPLRARVNKETTKNFAFVASAHRSLAPAVKEIVEKQTYEFSEDMINAPELTIADFASGATYPFTTQPYGTTEKMMPVFSLKSGRFWKQSAGTYYNLLCQFNYLPRENDDEVRLQDSKTLFLACNPGTASDYSTAQTKMRGVYCDLNMTRMRAQISFKAGTPVRLYGESYNTGTAPYSEQFTSPAISSIYMRVTFTPVSGAPKSFNGTKWVSGTAPCTITPPTSEGAVYEHEFTIPSADIDQPGVLHIEFFCGKYIILGDYEPTDADGNGMYMPVVDLKMTPMWETEAENKVTTKYNESNNIIIERNPAIGCLNFDTMSPQEVLNGVYSPETGCPAARVWSMSDGDLETQLPVLIHQQLLAYHSKPNNVLTGTMVTEGLPSFGCLWRWRGKEHLLLSGRINLATGHLDGATLREFIRYEDLFNN
jgi:hypothetical protein